ncbi:sigma-54-dependent Fis family transcriptional regulator [Sinimarinibacterium sp. NLF-5-8]|uniref:sigma-54-dependent Fis family transcriptional regulator n=1 Tax=Sinimarinibacterium sp. NLF-5-8 TaxID=2698684 RepID=UPI00137C35B0|nr:sigma-54-dependent Fis family transcriptional regulator [Sinimarinibacterium sp. NLF-5-8]QHS11301.1 sigma-54-dependent Fis family transcriptional regulator [Sinimarinibacterium sp. NLF-5-8]
MKQQVNAVTHVSNVMNMVYEFPRVPSDIDRAVAYSWLRCANEHRIRPDKPIDPAVLERAQLRERQQRMEDLVAIARTEMDSLYEQISGSGYALLLTDTEGVILSERVDPTLREDFHNAGLMTGANWSEAYEGTNGIGTCITERRPITIHLNDHFMSRHINLSCSASPIRDPSGDMIAVLDASCLSNIDSKASRMHSGALVNLSARLIEKCLFLRRNREHRVLRFHSRPEFVNLLHDGALAVGHDGRIVAADEMAVMLLAAESRAQLVGTAVWELFDISERELAESLRTGTRQTILPIRDVAHGRRYYGTLQGAQHEPLRTRRAPTEVVTVNARQSTESRHYTLAELSGSDPTMLRNLRCAQRIANSTVSVLIHGPTGSGKEVFARAVHNASERAQNNFVAINCAAIPESLIESELFGYKPGAFTGARRDGMRGRIQQSSGGTLFLDEIGDMPLQLQTRLLRVLEEREVTPLGSELSVQVDLRLISASHRNLREMIAEGKFREDLYYRLNGITMELPALSARADIDEMIRRVLAEETLDGRPVGIEMSAFELLMQHRWPGNLRELRNVIRTALAIAEGGVIRVVDLPQEVRTPMAAPIAHATFASVASPKQASSATDASTIGTGNPLLAAERAALLRAIETNRWNMTNTAQQLGMSRNTLYRKLKQHGISATALRSDGLSHF